MLCIRSKQSCSSRRYCKAAADEGNKPGAPVAAAYDAAAAAYEAGSRPKAAAAAHAAAALDGD